MQRKVWRAFLLSCCVLVMLLALVFTDHSACAAPLLRRVEPNTVPVSGGTKITIIGSGFDTSDAAVSVFVGGERCSRVTVHSGTRITAVVPASQDAGPAAVEVETGDAPRAVLEGALCYDDGDILLAKWYRIKAHAASVWRLMKQGGVILLLLTVLSVFAVAWAIHCALVIRTSQIMPKPFLEKLSGHISRREFQEAMDACHKDGYVFGRVALAALRKSGKLPHKVREAAQAAGSREASHLFQKISYLSNVGVISPMLGLLGTVFGMILAFKTIGMGEAGARHILLAEAIHKAMVTTAAGLTIGIPSMACFYYFRGKLLRIITEMEQVTDEVAEAVSPAGEEK